MAVIKDLLQVNAELQEQKERAETVDYKMITFSLAGKDYGVDIMNVKEIAKADKFTYVPNAASFIRGVYNLRGEIIPIIDLRLFFHLPAEKESGLENMIILKVGDRVYGTIVDRIDKVVGIDSESIQPPHPIFGDINIKYISGVVEKQGNLYIILDAIRIFSQNEDDKQKLRGASAEDDVSVSAHYSPSDGSGSTVDVTKKTAATGSVLSFVRETLPTLRHFYPSVINDEWILRRFAEWSDDRSGEALQLKSPAEADEYISSFYSPDTGRFWSEDYADLVKSLLPDLTSNNIHVWNIGCGKGYETFSFACILKSRYPGSNIKIWANDSDIIAVSQAPNLVFDLEDLPDFCSEYAVKGRSGYSFSQEIKDSIVFEYHDILNENLLPDLDIILVREVLSFIQVADQDRIVRSFKEKLKASGVVIPGGNEVLSGPDWKSIGKGPVSMFTYVG